MKLLGQSLRILDCVWWQERRRQNGWWLADWDVWDAVLAENPEGKCWTAWDSSMSTGAAKKSVGQKGHVSMKDQKSNV